MRVNSTMAVRMAAAVQGRSPNSIRQEYGWLPWVSLQLTNFTNEEILEFRADGITLSCFFGENDEYCRLSYLFPETEKEVADCVAACHRHYRLVTANLWMSHSSNTLIRLLRDAEVGHLFVFEAIG